MATLVKFIARFLGSSWRSNEWFHSRGRADIVIYATAGASCFHFTTTLVFNLFLEIVVGNPVMSVVASIFLFFPSDLVNI